MRLDKGLVDADVIMMQRIQLERQGKGFFTSLEEYFKFWRLDMRRLGLAEKDAVVMHFGSMNRGVEIASEVAECAQSIILVM